jgi:hypothetical protein
VRAHAAESRQSDVVGCPHRPPSPPCTAARAPEPSCRQTGSRLCGWKAPSADEGRIQGVSVCLEHYGCPRGPMARSLPNSCSTQRGPFHSQFGAAIARAGSPQNASVRRSRA